MRRNGWAALRHVWFNIMRGTVIRREGYCPLYLRFQLVAGNCVADGLATCMFWGVICDRVRGHVWSVHRNVGPWYWPVPRWWPLTVWIREVLSPASPNRRKAGFVQLDERRTGLRQDGQTMHHRMDVCKTEKAELRIVDWCRWRRSETITGRAVVVGAKPVML